MDYTSYYAARDVVCAILRKDLLGPVEVNEKIKDERPLEYYILGKLYPQKPQQNDLPRDEGTVMSPCEDSTSLDFDPGETLTAYVGATPSACGISFCILSDMPSFEVTALAARYILEIEDCDDTVQPRKNRIWVRQELAPLCVTVAVQALERSMAFQVAEGLELSIIRQSRLPDGRTMFTASLVNRMQSSGDYLEDCSNAFFQPEIRIASGGRPCFADVRQNICMDRDPESLELEMLYSGRHAYASGHGCSADWTQDDEGNAVEVRTEFLPFFELLQMKPASSFGSDFLSMKFLAEADAKTVIAKGRELTAAYADWISFQEAEIMGLASDHEQVGANNLQKCRETLRRLEKSLDTLSSPEVFNAFSLANRAMFEQRRQALKVAGKYADDASIRWYPFQIAFFLQEIHPIACPDSEERQTADLLWFPTGGGKTEAYLGIAAFTIFLRRLRLKDRGAGVTVLMRYTLRLLCFQQFERAATLICACEIIRKQENIPGGEIGIGLWVGSTLTPNRIEDAQKYLNDKGGATSPVQLRKCPWCGAEIQESEYRCVRSNVRMLVTCSMDSCVFAEGLPVYLIDEEIYHHCPSFIVSTVDKFAQLALNDDTFSLFGAVKGLRPPELVIQDELHLISGPLGTITGLYEAAIRKLCEYEGLPAKVLASSATIRNANEHIRALYATGHTLFPPQGIRMEDSFFATISQRDDKPARLYAGCMAIGTSATTMMIRVMASLLFATRYLAASGHDEKVVDSFWTLTGYFNSLRELGSALVRVVDDIQDRFAYLKDGKFLSTCPIPGDRCRYDRYKELTSREKSENIGEVVQKELKIPYRPDGSTDPYDFLLASNMISVGIDVGRLGIMNVMGQPKTTAEYIQATSRVGRETPGLVVTSYNQAKSRDRSHYEQFRAYHETFYRFVEATSVTPFSDRARDRALQAVYVILCRGMIPALRGNTGAQNYNPQMAEVAMVREYILEHVRRVDPAECRNVADDLDDIEREWQGKAGTQGLIYWVYPPRGNTLFMEDLREDERFRVLSSMRSVEDMIEVHLEITR